MIDNGIGPLHDTPTPIGLGGLEWGEIESPIDLGEPEGSVAGPAPGTPSLFPLWLVTG